MSILNKTHKIIISQFTTALGVKCVTSYLTTYNECENIWPQRTCFNSVYVHHVQVYKHGPDVGQSLPSNDGIRYCPPLLPQCLYQLIAVHWRIRTMSNSLGKMIPQMFYQWQVRWMGWPWQNVNIVCGEELLHHRTCVRSDIVLLKQESRLVLQEQ